MMTFQDEFESTVIQQLANEGINASSLSECKSGITIELSWNTGSKNAIASIAGFFNEDIASEIAEYLQVLEEEVAAVESQERVILGLRCTCFEIPSEGIYCIMCRTTPPYRCFWHWKCAGD